jgi:hypothetical protein
METYSSVNCISLAFPLVIHSSDEIDIIFLFKIDRYHLVQRDEGVILSIVSRASRKFICNLWSWVHAISSCGNLKSVSLDVNSNYHCSYKIITLIVTHLFVVYTIFFDLVNLSSRQSTLVQMIWCILSFSAFLWEESQEFDTLCTCLSLFCSTWLLSLVGPTHILWNWLTPMCSIYRKYSAKNCVWRYICFEVKRRDLNHFTHASDLFAWPCILLIKWWCIELKFTSTLSLFN